MKKILHQQIKTSIHYLQKKKQRNVPDMYKQTGLRFAYWYADSI